MTKVKESLHSFGRLGDSKRVAAAAVRLAISTDRAEERALMAEFKAAGLQGAAADFGGDYLEAISTIIERAVVAAKREGVIELTHAEEGAVAGAAHEAAMQLLNKAAGMSIGGKIGITRCRDHVCVCTFLPSACCTWMRLPSV